MPTSSVPVDFGFISRGMVNLSTTSQISSCDNFEAIAWTDPLFSFKGAQPPAGKSIGILLQDIEDIAPPESQLIRRLRDIVKQRLG